MSKQTFKVFLNMERYRYNESLLERYSKEDLADFASKVFFTGDGNVNFSFLVPSKEVNALDKPETLKRRLRKMEMYHSTRGLRLPDGYHLKVHNKKELFDAVEAIKKAIPGPVEFVGDIAEADLGEVGRIQKSSDSLRNTLIIRAIRALDGLVQSEAFNMNLSEEEEELLSYYMEDIDGASSQAYFGKCYEELCEFQKSILHSNEISKVACR